MLLRQLYATVQIKGRDFRGRLTIVRQSPRLADNANGGNTNELRMHDIPTKIFSQAAPALSRKQCLRD